MMFMLIVHINKKRLVIIHLKCKCDCYLECLNREKIFVLRVLTSRKCDFNVESMEM